MFAAFSSYGSWTILLVTLAFVEDASACIFRSSGNMFPTNQHENIIQDVGNPLVLDKDTVSVVEQTLIKTLIEMGKLKFHCPKEDGLYSDLLDCRKYYNCTGGNFTTHECEAGTGFEPMAKSCVGDESVSLCKRVQRLDGYKCNATGLETFSGHCEKFVLCIEEAAFTASCNRGDLFDQKLKLCLPEKEANCNENSRGEGVDNKTLSN